MPYGRFEDLPVWRQAIALAHGVYALTKDRAFTQVSDLRDQLRRAALSVSNNIAEGYERGSTAELRAFLYIARGAAGEVRSMLRFAEGCADMAHLASDVCHLVSVAESCSRQIKAWADQQQNSDMKGQRHVNDTVRAESDAKRRATELQRHLTMIVHQAHPETDPAPNASDRGRGDGSRWQMPDDICQTHTR